MSILTEGFPTTMTFSEAETPTALYFEEMGVTPPGVDGGGPNDTTNMRNKKWRTQQPKTLITLLAGQLTCHYDPAFLTGILAMINLNQLITITFPDLQYWTFWGWIDKFQLGEIVEGQPPTATVVIEVSNQDSDGNEVDPDLG